MQYLAFCFWLISLRNMPSRSIHVVTNDRISSFFYDWTVFLCVCVHTHVRTWLLSCVQPFVTPWTVAHQEALSIGILQAGILEWVAMTSSRGSSQPRDRTQVSHIESRLSSETPEKPMNTGVGSLSLPQGIFPTQELNWGLLHYRQIL